MFVSEKAVMLSTIHENSAYQPCWFVLQILKFDDVVDVWYEYDRHSHFVVDASIIMNGTYKFVIVFVIVNDSSGNHFVFPSLLVATLRQLNIKYSILASQASCLATCVLSESDDVKAGLDTAYRVDTCNARQKPRKAACRRCRLQA
jgi:hypothetical protein